MSIRAAPDERVDQSRAEKAWKAGYEELVGTHARAILRRGDEAGVALARD
jgi:hypothetical protein